MDHPDEKMANKDDEPAPSPGQDVALPTTAVDSASPPAPPAGSEVTSENLEKERGPALAEESSVQPGEVKSPRSSLHSPARDQDTSPSDSGDRTPTLAQDVTSPQPSEHSSSEPAETVDVAPVDLHNNSSTASTHSVPVPTASADDLPLASPSVPLAGDEPPSEDLEKEQRPTSPKESSTPSAEGRLSLDSPAQDQVASLSDSGERTPTTLQDPTNAEPSEEFPLEPAETTTETILVDLPDTSSSESTHSVPDSAAGLDSPMPPNSTAPSSTRTSLTDTPPVASSSSSSKPIGILRSATLPRSASSASMSAVTFAPLPPTEPRRRASHMQLGVAARSRMLRARRMRFVDPETGEAYIQVVDPALLEQQLQQGHPHYMYPGEDAAADGDPYRATRRQPRSPYATGAGGLWAHAQGAPAPDDEGSPEEDAFVALGKIVKGGAKALWRRVSKSQKAREAGPAEPIAADEGAEDAGARRPGVRRSASAPASLNGAPEDEELPEEDDATLHIEFREPRHCFEGATPAPPPLVPQSILRPATPLAAPAPAAAEVDAGAEAGAGARGDEVGRVWEEAIDTDLTKRFEAVARAERERERGKGRLVAKLVKAARRKESREALGRGSAL